MDYRRKCQKCGKHYLAQRPHSKYCSVSCRVGSHNVRRQREAKIQESRFILEQSERLVFHQHRKIAAIRDSLDKIQQRINQYDGYLLERLRSYREDLKSFHIRCQGQIEPVTGKRVPPYNEGGVFEGFAAAYIYHQRKLLFPAAEQNWKLARQQEEIRIQEVQQLLQIEQEKLIELNESVQKHQRQLSKLVKAGRKQLDTSANSKSELSQSYPGLGATDLLSQKIKTFTLFGALGRFLGELERKMLAIALVGDPGAGKSTITMAIAQLFDRAGYKTIFFSLEIGTGKPLQDMIRRYPLSNNVRITDTGDLDAVRQCAKEFDLVIVDSFGKLNCKAEEWDRLRQDFPRTMFLCIFQKTTSGSSRGGASVDYDAAMVINMTKEKETGKRVAHMRKSRYGTQGWSYYPEDDTVVEP